MRAWICSFLVILSLHLLSQDTNAQSRRQRARMQTSTQTLPAGSRILPSEVDAALGLDVPPPTANFKTATPAMIKSAAPGTDNSKTAVVLNRNLNAPNGHKIRLITPDTDDFAAPAVGSNEAGETQSRIETEDDFELSEDWKEIRELLGDRLVIEVDSEENGETIKKAINQLDPEHLKRLILSESRPKFVIRQSSTGLPAAPRPQPVDATKRPAEGAEEPVNENPRVPSKPAKEGEEPLEANPRAPKPKNPPMEEQEPVEANPRAKKAAPPNRNLHRNPSLRNRSQRRRQNPITAQWKVDRSVLIPTRSSKNRRP